MRNPLKTLFVFIVFLSKGLCENDLFLSFCGTWHHGNSALNLNVNISTGCREMLISANENSMSISGQITAYCTNSDVIPLSKFGLDSEQDTEFCLKWEPLLDMLVLEVGGRALTLCWPTRPTDSCCTDLTNGQNGNISTYGIKKGAIRGDKVTDKTLSTYNFTGLSTSYEKLCSQAAQSDLESSHMSDRPCAHRSQRELKKDRPEGFTVPSPVKAGFSSQPAVSVYIPPAVGKKTIKAKSKMVVTFYNSTAFQEVHREVKLLQDVVEITVENELIVDLSEPVKMDFHHDAVSKYPRRCVSWDTRKDPLEVNWLMDGCVTNEITPKHTECLCNHLTYFSVMVQMEPRPMRHILELTAITSVGCAVSFISCVGLMIILCRKKRCSKEQSLPIHLGLTAALALLSLLFFFTGVLANVGGDRVCVWVGALLHYALLSSLIWMGIEVLHTFWLVYMVFKPCPKLYVWNLLGFGLPLLPVVVLLAVGDIYGLREVLSTSDPPETFRMCWMKVSHQALLAQCFTTMTVLALLVSSGIIILFLVFREIRTRDEWKQRRVAFLSIWGLSCLFGSTWCLIFLDFEPVSDFIHFLFCILNSFQGFFVMLRFCLLNWMRKQASGSVLSSTSSGSTRQHMLQAQEQS
ncbi:G-protein coupled receptor 126 [Oryzias melastigma]|uniref:G-protein coupled receptor 126 n=1 Tax=Oryzias melastigma TaxID=30732 RepID=A0A834CB84_ORYME|nr:G-protein coupled receptor 126 [Oryzias melastigma]